MVALGEAATVGAVVMEEEMAALEEGAETLPLGKPLSSPRQFNHYGRETKNSRYKRD